MAFDPSKVGGNINASALGASFFTYETDDTEAVVATPGYFMQKDANGQLTSGDSTAHKIFSFGDIVMANTADGLGYFLITVSDATVVSAKLTLSEP